MHPVDEFAFVVGLPARHLDAVLCRVGGHHVGHVRQGGVPVHVGLSFA